MGERGGPWGHCFFFLWAFCEGGLESEREREREHLKGDRCGWVGRSAGSRGVAVGALVKGLR